jgi:multicomponent Na+:H+ antiporter subunit D
LTLVSMSKIWVSAFWGEPSVTDGSAPSPDAEMTSGSSTVALAAPPRRRLQWPALMIVGTVGLVAVGLAVALFGGPLYGLCERAAAEIVVPAVHSTVRGAR